MNALMRMDWPEQKLAIWPGMTFGAYGFWNLPPYEWLIVICGFVLAVAWSATNYVVLR